MKKLFIHGMLAGLLSGMASVIYLHIYQEALGVNYSQIINIGSILAASVIACLLMTLAYLAMHNPRRQKWMAYLNLVFVLLSFISIIGPIGMSLPLDIEYPELFPGLVVPMHFFPALVFLSIHPFFQQNSRLSIKGK